MIALNRPPSEKAEVPILPLSLQRRIELRFGDADPRGLGGEIPLGDAHVRPLTERIGGNAGRDLIGAVRDRLRFAQLPGQRPRRPPGEHRDPVGRAGEGGFEIGDGGRGLGARGARLLAVERGDEARLDPPAGDLEVVVGDGERVAGKREPLLRLPRLDVVGSDLGGDRDAQRLAIVKDALRIGPRGLDPAPDPAEQIDLPGRVGADAEARLVVARPEIAPRAGRSVRGRQQPGPRLHQRFPGLDEPRPGLDEIEIAFARLVDQPGEQADR